MTKRDEIINGSTFNVHQLAVRRNELAGWVRSKGFNSPEEIGLTVSAMGLLFIESVEGDSRLLCQNINLILRAYHDMNDIEAAAEREKSPLETGEKLQS
jgi:hypothetical protein